MERLREIKKRKENEENYDVIIKIGMGTSGIASGSNNIMEQFKKLINEKYINAKITKAGDMGYNFAEPTVEVKKKNQEPIIFGEVDNDKVKKIIDNYIIKDELIDGILPKNFKTIN